MDSSDDDAPIGYTKMEAPSPSPSLPQPSSPPPQSSLTSPKPTATSSPNVNPQGSSGDPAAGKLSTAGRIKLSVAALITGRDDSVTPAPDHFTVLPGEAHASFARDENFAVRRDAEQPVKHAIKHGLTDSERKWGREGLLGSKTKSVTAGGAAADAKRKLSAHLGMSARKGEEGEQQSCEYVAMNTPCESPVAEGNRVNHEEQRWGAREGDRRNSTSTHSSSSRTGLVTRLGSAIQSWTSGGSYPSKSWGSGSTAAREGRPGPLGAKYTQQAPENYSPFEPSPHYQLQKKLPVKSAFTAAAAARREQIQVEAPNDEQMNLAGSDGRSPTTTAADCLPPTTSGDLLHADEDRPESPGVEGTTLQERGTEGQDSPPIDGYSHSTPSPRSRRGSSDDVRKACSNGERGSRATTEGSTDGSMVGSGDKPARKIGLWELKAERSRLESALADAEADRDVEKAKAWEAANRLEEAVARLEGVLEGGTVNS